MWKRINDWPMLFMVLATSVISIFLLQNHVSAQWTDPTTLPNENDSQVFFNPAVDNLDLNNNAIVDSGSPSFIIDPGGEYGLRIGGSDFAGYFDGNVNIDGQLFVNGDIIEGGAEYFPELFDSPGPSNSSTDYIGQGGKFLQVNQDEDGLAFGEMADPEYLWTENGSDIYRDSNVGIGSTTPSKLLSLESNSGTDAAISIQSGNNDRWEIYNEETSESSNDLRFWNTNTGDAMILTNTGNLLIGTTTISANLGVEGSAYFSDNSNRTIDVLNTNSSGYGIYAEGHEAIKGYSSSLNGSGVFGFSNNVAAGNGVYGIGPTGVYGESNTSGSTSYGVHGISGTGVFGGYFSSTAVGGAGVRGETTVGTAGVWGVATGSADHGVRGEGLYGVAGFPNSAGGAGIYGEGNATNDAAYFEGDLVITDYSGTDAFLQLDNISGTPSSGDCDSSHNGRMIYDTTGDFLWVCSGTTWKSLAF